VDSSTLWSSESTVDAATPTGADVPIEVRDDAELTRLGDQQISPSDTPALNYAFDVTPADLVTAIVTETRVVA
jgi:methylthioribose-1-phosphate isomerase/methylthioribulose-1-phosphate dehydratase